MKLSKAIEILSGELKEWGAQDPRDYTDAIKLGIEALKSIAASRSRPVPYNIAALPGEDPE